MMHVLSQLLAQRSQPVAHRSRFRSLLSESLEDRLLLTASGLLEEAVHLDNGSHAAEVASQPSVAHGSTAHHDGPAGGFCIDVQLRIDGTSVGYDALTGLPNHLEGNVFYVGGHADGNYAGTYQEDIVPLIHPDFGLIGADGVGVFHFMTVHGRPTLGDLTVTYRAMIVGMDPTTGALMVQSEGTIVDGTRLLRDVEGGFTTSSTVMLGEHFSMRVDVSMHACNTLPALSHNAWSPIVRVAKAGAARWADAQQSSWSGNRGLGAQQDHWANVSDWRAADSDHAEQLSSRGRRVETRELFAKRVDQLLAKSSTTDWLGDHLSGVWG